MLNPKAPSLSLCILFWPQGCFTLSGSRLQGYTVSFSPVWFSLQILHVLWSWKARFLCFVFDVNWKTNKQTGLYCHRPSSSSGKWWDKCWEISECYLPVPFLLLHNFPHCSLISPRSSFYLYDGDSVTTTSGNGNGKNHFLYQRSFSFRLSLDLCFSRSLCPW